MEGETECMWCAGFGRCYSNSAARAILKTELAPSKVNIVPFPANLDDKPDWLWKVLHIKLS